MKLKKVAIGENRYVHKFKLANDSIVTVATTKASYDNLATTKPIHTSATWIMSSIRIGFDTPTGNLSDGQYATQDNGYHWVKIPGYAVTKIDPEFINNKNLSPAGEADVMERSEAE